MDKHNIGLFLGLFTYIIFLFFGIHTDTEWMVGLAMLGPILAGLFSALFSMALGCFFEK